MIAIKLIVLGVVFVLGAYLWRRIGRNSRRKRLLAKPIKPEWKEIIEKNIPLYKHLSEPLQSQLAGLVSVFLAEKRFEGCGGQEITDEVRVTIAAQACMLILNRKTRYFPKLRSIYVYPATYVAKQASDGGRQSRLGESWQNGPVVLAWNSVTGGANNIHDGRNVVFHEFSHQLDQEDGSADGAPILQSSNCYRTWAKVLGAEYETLRGKARKRRKSVVRKYGATNPAEFFAVATEAFLEKPKQMKKKHPQLYEELKNYYRLDPVEWA
jgi:Mlc titration factor MtfA (ptsG expression regulator)